MNISRRQFLAGLAGTTVLAPSVAWAGGVGGSHIYGVSDVDACVNCGKTTQQIVEDGSNICGYNRNPPLDDGSHAASPLPYDWQKALLKTAK